MNFKLNETQLSGVFLIQRTRFNDERGYFTEFFREDFFKRQFKEINFVLRGLHFQKLPFSQGKLVSVIHGKILDVAVNLKNSSKDFGKYVMAELSEDNCNSLYIPDYCAHGFVALEDSYVLYKTTEYYHKESERGIRYDDPDIGVKWNIDKPVISEKDLKLTTFKELIQEGDYF